MLLDFACDNRPVRVLSLAGGGFLGLYAAVLLDDLESRMVRLFSRTDAWC